MTAGETEIGRDIDAPAGRRGFVLWLAAPALALAAICGFLWMRYGAQVFVDAALFAWRSCF